MFWKDIGVGDFGLYHLNESWSVDGVLYYGINHLRIIFNQSEITHVFGIILFGDIVYRT